jgi:hypothetical protein
MGDFADMLAMMNMMKGQGRSYGERRTYYKKYKKAKRTKKYGKGKKKHGKKKAWNKKQKIAYYNKHPGKWNKKVQVMLALGKIAGPVTPEQYFHGHPHSKPQMAIGHQLMGQAGEMAGTECAISQSQVHLQGMGSGLPGFYGAAPRLIL